MIVSLTSKGRVLKESAKEVPLKMAKCLSLTEDEFTALYKGAYKILGR